MKVGWCAALLPLGFVCMVGCGGQGAISLTIDATSPTGELRVPDDIDKIVVKVTTPDGATTLLEKEYPLAADVQCTSATAACGDKPADAKFPLTLGLEPGPKTGKSVKIYVTALKSEAMVGETNALVPINPSQLTGVTVRIVKS